MKKYIILFLFLFTLVSCFSQGKDGYQVKDYYNYTAVHLKRMLLTAKADTEKLNILNTLATGVTMQNDDVSIDTLLLYKLFEINKRAKLINDAPYHTLLAAIRASGKKNYVQELTLLEKTINEFEAKGMPSSGLLYVVRWIFSASNQQDKKLSYYSQKLQIYLAQKNYLAAATCYHCLAGYYIFEGDDNSAINSYLKSADLYKSHILSCYLNEILVAGNLYADWGNTGKALFYLKKGLKLLDSCEDKSDGPYVLNVLTRISYDSKKFNESLAYIAKFKNYHGWMSYSDSATVSVEKALNYIALNRLSEAKNTLDSNNLVRFTAVERIGTVGSYGPEYAYYKYYVAVHDFKKAEEYLKEAYERANRYEPPGRTLSYLREFAAFYGGRRDNAAAWHYTSLANKLEDSLQRKTNKFKVASYEDEQKESEQQFKVATLQQQQAVQQATIGKRNVIIMLSLAGLLIVCASLVFIYRQLQSNKKTLSTLRQTQTQLIQAEKMASLGELTAGIAHEIQNPLNFVNNFSEVSAELVDEMDEELAKGDITEARAIAADVKQNLKKIRHHGKRADSIVKGMLEHSKVGSGEKTPTDVNALADEFLKLSYHGLRAKDKTFNAELVTDFDENLPKVNIAQQDIGRVLLNLFNNAFYAVKEKQKTAGDDYEPTVTVTTFAPPLANGGWGLEIKVKDNGNGIPDAIKEKIMQPFFTTKPTGEGTGLGLSLSYDIVVKGHGGTINVNTKEGEFTEFIILLPLS